MVSCRVAVGHTKSCTPYPFQFLHAKTIEYTKDRQKLIVEKTLPSPQKATSKDASVIDMIEKYVQVEESVRFSGTMPLGKNTIDSSDMRAVVYQRLKRIEILREALMHTLLVEQPSYALASSSKDQTKPQEINGIYRIQKGDTLGHIALRFGLSLQRLTTYNKLQKNSALRIGQKLKLPLSQKQVDSIASATYVVEEGDTLGSIASLFNLSVSSLKSYNKLKKEDVLKVGQKLSLPLAYVLEKKKKLKRLQKFGRHTLRVTATAYSSHSNQTDKTPFLAAWNNRLRPGMKIIAVSRDLLTKYGMRNGTKVKISALPGIYRVRDKMNKRYTKRIDIYMGLNRRKALRWGRRSVVIYW